MANDNVAAIRNAYAIAERKGLEGWISLLETSRPETLRISAGKRDAVFGAEVYRKSTGGSVVE